MSVVQESPIGERIRKLQTHLHTHPNSPLFARLADSLLETGDPERALQLCLEGLKFYPDYAAAHFVLAKTYVMLRRYHDARESLKIVYDLAPMSTRAYDLERRSYLLERQYPPTETIAFEIPATSPLQSAVSLEERERRWSQKDDLIPGAEVIPSAEEAAAVELAATPPVPTIDLDLELLAERLENAHIPVLQDEIAPASSGLRTRAQQTEIESRPATETLARIYEQQGQFVEAIRTYEALKYRQPRRAAEFDERIVRLQSLLSS